MPEEKPDPENPDNFSEPPSFFPRDFSGEPEEESSRLVEVAVEAVYAREDGPSLERFVVLRDGYRRLPIVIDPCNAHSISLPLDGAVPDRPLTHDLIKSILDRFEAQVDRVVIDDLWSTTYYAKVMIRQGEQEIEIDSRPSDAIAIAVRCGCPILVSESIMDSASD
jgi:bifunctional DNase/RNase